MLDSPLVGKRAACAVLFSDAGVGRVERSFDLQLLGFGQVGHIRARVAALGRLDRVLRFFAITREAVRVIGRVLPCDG